MASLAFKRINGQRSLTATKVASSGWLGSSVSNDTIFMTSSIILVRDLPLSETENKSLQKTTEAKASFDKITAHVKKAWDFLAAGKLTIQAGAAGPLMEVSETDMPELEKLAREAGSDEAAAYLTKAKADFTEVSKALEEGKKKAKEEKKDEFIMTKPEKAADAEEKPIPKSVVARIELVMADRKSYTIEFTKLDEYKKVMSHM